MPVHMITCSDCGARHHHRFACSCSRGGKKRGASGMGGRIGFILGWIAVAILCAGVVFLAIWWAGAEFGRFRGTIAAAGILMLVNLLVLGMLTESWLDGDGKWDPFNHMFGNIMGGLVETAQDLIAIRTLHQMERPWMKAVLVGSILGILLGTTRLSSPGGVRPATLLNGPMPVVALPLVGGGEFRTEDLSGRTTVVMIRDNRGQSAGRLGDAWNAAFASEGAPDHLLVVMDQYGEVQPYGEGRWMKAEGPIAVGRKWLRESFGDFEGEALLLVVDRDLVVRHARSVGGVPPISSEEAGAIISNLFDQALTIDARPEGS